MAQYSLSDVIQVSGTPETPNWFEKTLFTPFLKPKSTSDSVHANVEHNVCKSSKTYSDQHILEPKSILGIFAWKNYDKC